MNPLSPLTYTLRHKRRALMLVALLALAVAGLSLLVGLMHGTYFAPLSNFTQHLSKFSLVEPGGAGTLDPAVVAQIRVHPEVSQVLPQRNVVVLMTSVGGTFVPRRLIALRETDMTEVLAHSGVTLIEGQLPQPHTNGVALSWEMAAALDLEIGDTTDSTKDDFAYASIASPLEVVGILEGDVQLGVVSYEYLEGHERYRDVVSHGVLVIAHPGGEAAVDDFLRQDIRSSSTEVHTHQLVMEEVNAYRTNLQAVLIPIVLLVTAAITAVIGAVNRLAFLRRLPEFGALHAIGRSKAWLARRLTLEAAGLAVIGWAIGLLVSMAGMAFLSRLVYEPRGYAYDPIQGAALLLVVPLPLAVIGSTRLTATRVLRRMDAVAIVERGELSLEEARPYRGRSRRAVRGRAGSLPRPLASTTFYRRHVRQAVVLVCTMTLMIVGTALFAFVASAWGSVLQQPILTPLKPLSLISPRGLPLDTTMVAQVRAHPAVERTAPAYILTPLDVTIPMLLPHAPVEAYGVTAEDMAYVVDLYGLELAEGHLPQPNTNQIVIAWTVAQNRDIRVGDVIGDPSEPVYPGAPNLPSTLVISGIFAPRENWADENWLSFMSYEFLSAYQDRWRGDLSLIVVPKAGQKGALDGWLESQLTGERYTVLTYGNQRAQWERRWNTGLIGLTLMTGTVALVAAVALAGLNTIFVTQRQAELGVLNALGLSRHQLVWRIAREAIFITIAAWLLGVIVCAIILVWLQVGVYVPLGLKINYFDPTPWFYTLPVPIAVFLASAGTIAWALSRLDPVAVIERR